MRALVAMIVVASAGCSVRVEAPAASRSAAPEARKPAASARPTASAAPKASASPAETRAPAASVVQLEGPPSKERAYPLGEPGPMNPADYIREGDTFIPIDRGDFAIGFPANRFLQILAGESFQLATSAKKPVTWELAPEDAARARLDADGTLHGLAPGPIHVSATTTDGTATATLACVASPRPATFLQPGSWLSPGARSYVTWKAEGRTQVLDDAAAWQQAWSACYPQAGDAPALDFGQETGVLIFTRNGPTSQIAVITEIVRGPAPRVVVVETASQPVDTGIGPDMYPAGFAHAYRVPKLPAGAAFEFQR